MVPCAIANIKLKLCRIHVSTRVFPFSSDLGNFFRIYLLVSWINFCFIDSLRDCFVESGEGPFTGMLS